MKTLFLSLVCVSMLCGCGTTPSPMTKAAVTAAVAASTGFGLEQYPQAAPEVSIAKNVICATAASTNVDPAQVVSALTTAGITNANAKFIVNGALAIYDTVFASYGSNWVNSVPALQGYLSAVCDGLTEALPSPGPAALSRKELPPHLKP